MSRATIRSSLVLALVWSVAAGDWARADGPAPAVPAPAPAAGDALAKERAADPLTTLEGGVLKRVARVALARAKVLREAVGSAPMLVRVEVERWLYGTPQAAESGEFTLFVGGPPSDTVPGRFYAPYFPPGSAGRYVLFLAATPAGSGWSLDSMFSVEGPDGDEKVFVLEKEIALTGVKDPAERRAKTLAHLVGLLASDRPWSRLHAARELAVLAKAAPGAFTPAAIQEIGVRRARTTDARATALLSSVLSRFPDVLVEAAPAASAPIGLLAPDAEPPAGSRPRAPAPAPPAQATPGPPSPELLALRKQVAEATDPAARVQALAALAKAVGAAAAPDLVAALLDPDASVREQAALLAGDVSASDAWPSLEARYATESSEAVREAIVRAAGLLRDPRLVSWVEARGAEKGMRRTATFALARIRTPEALAVLARWREAATAACEPAAARLVEYVTSDAFVRVERQAKRDVGPR